MGAPEHRIAPAPSVSTRRASAGIANEVAWFSLGGMIDLARVAVLAVAIVYAVRYRFALGLVFGACLACALGRVFYDTISAAIREVVNGEYGPALVYFGPTMVPVGRRSFWQWSPAIVQAGLAVLSAVPAARVLREPASPVTTPFLLVFVPNAMLAVITCLSSFLLWHQESSFPEYWQDHL